MRLLAAAALAGACLATSPLLAADLFESAPPPMDAPDRPVELGSNWYIRGDVGYGETNQATVKTDTGLFPTIGNMPIGDASSPVPVTRGNNTTTTSPDFGLGFGYRINDWFRVEANWQYSTGPGWSTQKTVYCPEVANAVSNYGYTSATDTSGTGTAVGYQYDYTTCDGRLNISQYNNTGLVMGYADLGHYGLFTPFIGVGAGVNINSMSGTLKFNQTDTGQTYAGATVNGSAPGVWVTPSGYTDQTGRPIYTGITRPTPQSGQSQPVGVSNWQRNISATKYSFAVAAAAGLGMKISQSATLDLAYKIMSLDVTSGAKGTRQSVSLGVRYNIN